MLWLQRRLLCLIFFYFFSLTLFSQITELQGTIKLKSHYRIFKLVTVSGCLQAYTPPAGSSTTVTHEKKFINAKTEITVESVITSNNSNAISIPSDKELKIPVPAQNSEKASLFLDDKDKTKLYINYYLIEQVTLPAGTIVREYTQTYNCNSNTPVKTNGPNRTLAAPETYSYKIVSPASPETTQAWFTHSNGIEVLDNAGTVVQYLVNRYDGSGKYILELDNRKYIPYSSSSLHLSALTIPFKVRFGFTRNNIEVKDDIAANANIGIYGGVKTSRYYVVNKAGTYTNKVSSSWRIGPFISLSAVAVDSITTTVGKVPMKKDNKETIAVLSTGTGLMYELKGVQLGVFCGWDFAMGSSANNWNYHKRFWLGVGVGYKISDLFAQKE